MVLSFRSVFPKPDRCNEIYRNRTTLLSIAILVSACREFLIMCEQFEKDAGLRSRFDIYGCGKYRS